MKTLFSLHAKRDIERIPRHEQEKILLAIEKFSKNTKEDLHHFRPAKGDIAKIDNLLFEIRAGNYRVISRVENGEMTIISIFQRNSVFDESR